MLERDYNLLTHQIIQCAIEVHKAMGPGLMESVYEVCLYEELRSRGWHVEKQKMLPISYKGGTT
jgi:GxxExxY protein